MVNNPSWKYFSSEDLFPALGTTAAATLWMYLLAAAAHGLDFSDESFHLLWLAHPWSYPGSTSLFGFVYHPLHWLTGGDIAAIRRVNIIITLGLAWAATALTLREIRPYPADPPSGGQLRLWGTALLISSGSAIYFFRLMIPSYNTLSFQGLLVAYIGILLARGQPDRLAGWLILGLGGWLTFMAKPSTALALALSALLYFAATRSFNLKKLAIAGLCALAWLALSAFIIDGTVAGFINRFETGWADIQTTATSYSASGLLGHVLHDRPLWPATMKYFMSSLIVVGFLTLFLGASKDRPAKMIWRIMTVGWLIIAVLALASPGWGRIFFLPLFSTLGWFYPALPVFIFIGGAGGALILAPAGGRNCFNALATLCPLAGFALLLPLMYAFGTGNNYWRQAAPTSIFWSLGLVVLIAALGPKFAGLKILAGLGACQLAMVCGLLVLSHETPYRQMMPLRLQKDEIIIRTSGKAIFIGQNRANYVRELQQSAEESGFKPGTPFIDLTGRLPGAAYVLGGHPPGVPWLVGGYSGSPAFAARVLDRADRAVLRQAWVLMEPQGRRRHDAELLRRYGLDPDADLVEVGVLVWPDGPQNTSEHKLFKPR